LDNCYAKIALVEDIMKADMQLTHNAIK